MCSMLCVFSCSSIGLVGSGGGLVVLGVVMVIVGCLCWWISVFSVSVWFSLSMCIFVFGWLLLVDFSFSLVMLNSWCSGFWCIIMLWMCVNGILWWLCDIILLCMVIVLCLIW